MRGVQAVRHVLRELQFDPIRTDPALWRQLSGSSEALDAALRCLQATAELSIRYADLPLVFPPEIMTLLREQLLS